MREFWLLAAEERRKSPYEKRKTALAGRFSFAGIDTLAGH